jgi:hypothetical protein
MLAGTPQAGKRRRRLLLLMNPAQAPSVAMLAENGAMDWLRQVQDRGSQAISCLNALLRGSGEGQFACSHPPLPIPRSAKSRSYQR